MILCPAETVKLLNHLAGRAHQPRLILQGILGMYMIWIGWFEKRCSPLLNIG